MLLEAHIAFDIAIVDYGMRASSQDEVEYAKYLATKYNKKIYIHHAKNINSNFEKTARDIRYKFFEQIIHQYSYTNLITAHQLNDRVEWMMMQFIRGAGLVELMGFDECDSRDGYTLVRPMLDTRRDDIEQYLVSNNIKYFIDESNKDEKYSRNKIRKQTNIWVSKYHKGIAKSFKYLNIDKHSLLSLKSIQIDKNLVLIEKSNDDNQNIRYIDKALKTMGLLISKAQRDEILRSKDCVISSSVAVVFGLKYIFISQYLNNKMDKNFKEQCRKLAIPAKIRPYLYKYNLLDKIKEYL